MALNPEHQSARMSKKVLNALVDSFLPQTEKVLSELKELRIVYAIWPLKWIIPIYSSSGLHVANTECSTAS